MLGQCCERAPAFHCFLRTGELLAVRKSDFMFAADAKSGILNLHGTKGGNRRNQQEVVTIDDPALARWLSRLLRPLLPGDPFIPLTQRTFRSFYADLLKTLDLQEFGFKPYSLRRGGATHHYRSFADINATCLRGRWESLKTGRIYITDGLAKMQEIQYTPVQKAWFRHFGTVLSKDASRQ